MKRINLTIDEELYEKTRRISFVTRRSISDILREAVSEWLVNHSFGQTGELLLSAKDESEILEILEKNEFVSLDAAKDELGL